MPCLPQTAHLVLPPYWTIFVATHRTIKGSFQVRINKNGLSNISFLLGSTYGQYHNFHCKINGFVLIRKWNAFIWDTFIVKFNDWSLKDEWHFHTQVWKFLKSQDGQFWFEQSCNSPFQQMAVREKVKAIFVIAFYIAIILMSEPIFIGDH